jgi:hypothetical protein
VESLFTNYLNENCTHFILYLHRLQFPSERQTQDNIEWAGDLLLDTQSRISVADIQIKNEVDQLKAAYESVQESIKACAQQVRICIRYVHSQ